MQVGDHSGLNNRFLYVRGLQNCLLALVLCPPRTALTPTEGVVAHVVLWCKHNDLLRPQTLVEISHLLHLLPGNGEKVYKDSIISIPLSPLRTKSKLK